MAFHERHPPAAGQGNLAQQFRFATTLLCSVSVFYASLSDVDFDLEVLDTTTGQRRTYHNPKGTMASRADVEAF